MQRLCALTSWLNNNSGVVTTLATVVIAYAPWISSRIIRLQKRIERANRMPVLTFVERVEAGWRSVFVKNVGYGPAEHRQENRKKIERIPGIQPKECLTIGALGSGGDTSAFIATEPGDSSTPY